MFDHYQLSKFLMMTIGIFIITLLIIFWLSTSEVTTPLPDSMACLENECTSNVSANRETLPTTVELWCYSFGPLTQPQIQAFRPGFCLAALCLAQHDLKQERMMMLFLLNDIIVCSCLKRQHYSPTIEDCNVVCPPPPPPPPRESLHPELHHFCFISF